jgi:hypothetical protein
MPATYWAAMVLLIMCILLINPCRREGFTPWADVNKKLYKRYLSPGV